MPKAILSVGEVSKRSGVKVSTVHFYEKKGLISSVRNAGNQRRFARDVLRRIALIKAAQKVGVSLEEIKNAFSELPQQRTATKADWQNLANNWKESLNERIYYLSSLRDKLSQCIGCGCLSLTNCPLYNKDDKLGDKESGPILLERAAKNKCR